MLQTLIAVPAPEDVDLGDLYPKVAGWSVGDSLYLFLEEGEIRIKAEAGIEAPDGLADFLTAYESPPPKPAQPRMPTYDELRRMDYLAEMPIEDQLEAILEGGAKLDTVKAKYAAIKKRHPKPTP